MEGNVASNTAQETLNYVELPERQVQFVSLEKVLGPLKVCTFEWDAT